MPIKCQFGASGMFAYLRSSTATTEHSIIHHLWLHGNFPLFVDVKCVHLIRVNMEQCWGHMMKRDLLSYIPLNNHKPKKNRVVNVYSSCTLQGSPDKHSSIPA